MPANTVPIFIKTPNTGTVSIAAAETARVAPLTNVYTAFTAGADGSRVDTITFTSTQTIGSSGAAKVVRVWITDTSGLNPKLYRELALSAVTPSATAVGQTGSITFTNGLLLKSGQLLRVTSSVASGTDLVDVVCQGGDY